MGLGEAIERVTADIEGHSAELSEVRDRLIDRILSEIPYVRLNGHRTQRLPGN